MSTLTLDELNTLAESVGFPDPALAAAVAMAESRGNPQATAIVTDPLPGNGPERSFGLWQINTLAHPNYNEASLLDPTYNAHAAYQISSAGTNWTPWSTYTSGAYKKYYSPPWFGVDKRIVWAGLAVGAGAYATWIAMELYGVPRWAPRWVRRIT